jgi:prepilin-type processing-associated H-X9-DG protein/prepilin-type N-terminal cleavage/methylation domain-containing protein
MKSIGKNSTFRGYTMPELLATIAVIAFVALFLLPALMPQHHYAPRIKCVSNLKQVGLAFRIWEGDNNDNFPMRYYTNSLGQPSYTDSANLFHYFQVMSNELNNPNVVICPDDRKRIGATNWDNDFNGSHISYFAGLEAKDALPQSFLAGDANITNGLTITNGLLILTTNLPPSWTKKRHDGAGNILFADGSVQELSTAALRITLQKTGMVTNRLLLPP